MQAKKNHHHATVSLKKKHMKLASAATCFLVFITVALYIVTRNGTPQKTLDESLGVTPSIDMASVRYCKDGSGKNVNESVPAPGNINMAFSLNEEVLKAENKDRYYAVSIDFLYFDCVEEYQESMHEKYLNALNDPAIVLYEEEYEKWIESVVKPNISPEDMEQFEEKVYHTRRSYQQFEEECWKIIQSEEAQTAYQEAEKRRLQAWKDYMAFNVDSDQILFEKFSKDVEIEIYAELERLKKLGYNLEVSDKTSYYQNFDCGHLSGYLTGEQLSSFSCNPKHGYCITWNEREGVND